MLDARTKHAQQVGNCASSVRNIFNILTVQFLHVSVCNVDDVGRHSQLIQYFNAKKKNCILFAIRSSRGSLVVCIAGVY